MFIQIGILYPDWYSKNPSSIHFCLKNEFANFRPGLLLFCENKCFSYVLMCMYVDHTHDAMWRLEKGFRSPVVGMVSSMWYWVLNRGSLQAQQVLLTLSHISTSYCGHLS